MRVAIGAVLGSLGGPATYARELIRALAETARDLEILAFTDAPTALADARPTVRVVRAPLAGPFAQPLWDHVVIPRLVRRHRPDLYHGTKGVLPLHLDCPAVLTIHDLAVYHFPDTFAWQQRLHQRWELPHSVRRAVRVIADSEHARRDIASCFALALERVVAIPLGVDPRFRREPTADDEVIAARLDLPKRYLLYAGTVQPRKHVEALVEAYQQWQGGADCELIVAGRLRPGYRPAFIDTPPPRVRYLGAVSDAELATLYRRALALVSPSDYEGFGLSLLEAMASGCLVVAGGNSAAVELLDGVGVLLPRTDAATIHRALDALWRNQHEWASQRARGLERAARYRWSETARRTREVYHSVLAGGR